MRTRPRLALLVAVAITGLLASRLLGASNSAHGLPRHISDFALVDDRDCPFYLYRESDAKAIVLVSLTSGAMANDDPMDRVRTLAARYGASGVRFWMVSDTPLQSSPDAGPRVLLDDGRVVSHEIGFRVAPEAVLIDTRGWTARYQGAIGEALCNAIDDAIVGRAVRVDYADAEGVAFEAPSVPHVSYERVVAPLLLARCVPCHSASSIAPLDTYAHVRKLAPTIRETLLARRMPPWPLDPRYGKFRGDRSLSQREMRALIAWIDLGAPRDGGADPLARARPRHRHVRRFGAGKPDFVWRMPQPVMVPAHGHVKYRRYQLAGPLAHDLWLHQVRLLPSNPAAVHHSALLVLKVPLSAAVERRIAQERVDADPAMERISHSVMGIHPGQRERGVNRTNMAWRIPRGTYLVLEQHYHASGQVQSDLTTVKLWYYHGYRHPVAKRSTTIAISDPIPPGVRRFALTQRHTFRHDIWVLSLVPHMHLRGIALKADVIGPDGKKETLISVPFYNFYQQGAYRFVKPYHVRAGSTIVLTALFDNSANNPANPDPTQTVTVGPYTDTNELARLGLVYYTHAGSGSH